MSDPKDPSYDNPIEKPDPESFEDFPDLDDLDFDDDGFDWVA